MQARKAVDGGLTIKVSDKTSAQTSQTVTGKFPIAGIRFGFQLDRGQRTYSDLEEVLESRLSLLPIGFILQLATNESVMSILAKNK